MQFWKMAAVAALALTCALPAQAANLAFTENSEPNDTIAQAQALVVPFGTGTDQSAIFTVQGSLEGEQLGVVDWYSFVIPPITEGVVFREVEFNIFRQNQGMSLGTFLPYRFANAAGQIIDADTFLTQDGGTYYLGIEKIAGATGYLASIAITAIPEPGTWALMLAGFAMTGYALRRRRATVTFA